MHLVHYEPGRFEQRPSGCQWGGGGNDSLNHPSWLYILFTLAARFWQAPLPLLPTDEKALMPLTGVTHHCWGDGGDRGQDSCSTQDSPYLMVHISLLPGH